MNGGNSQPSMKTRIVEPLFPTYEPRAGRSKTPPCVSGPRAPRATSVDRQRTDRKLPTCRSLAFPIVSGQYRAACPSLAADSRTNSGARPATQKGAAPAGLTEGFASRQPGRERRPRRRARNHNVAKDGNVRLAHRASASRRSPKGGQGKTPRPALSTPRPEVPQSDNPFLLACSLFAHDSPGLRAVTQRGYRLVPDTGKRRGGIRSHEPQLLTRAFETCTRGQRPNSLIPRPAAYAPP